MFLMLQCESLGHGLVDECHGQGGEKENDVDDDLPHECVLGQVGADTFGVNR